jgi:uncharacterized protein (DUF3084 family)
MAGENAILQLVTDIREGMKEVKTDMKELRTEVHGLSVKFAEMGDTHSKIDNVDGRLSEIANKVDANEERLRKAEQTLAVVQKQGDAVDDLQKDYWKSAGKAAGIGAAILAFISLGGLLVKLLGS